MIYSLFKNELKALWRSSNVGPNVVVRVIIGGLIIYLLVNALLAGFFMDIFLRKLFPGNDPTVSFCGLMLVYYLIELPMRLQWQSLPTLNIQPYLSLPIKRDTLVGYLAFTGLFSTFNLWPILLFVPFILTAIAHHSGLITAFAFITSSIGLTIFNNYLALFIKRKSNVNGFVFLFAIIILVVVNTGDFIWHLYSIRHLSFWLFTALIRYPILTLLPLGLGAVMYAVNFLYLKKNLYLDELSTRKESYINTTEFPLFNRFGAPGDLAANELKLILRNKRPRAALIKSAVFLLYGFTFYQNPGMGHNDSLKVLAGMFMLGFFIVNYGKYMYSWQAAQFDGLLVGKINFADFLKAKYLLFSLTSTLAFILTTPYLYFGWRTLLIHFALFLWNLGVNTTIVLYFANRNTVRIDLNKGVLFNWEGMGANQVLSSYPLILAPFLFYLSLRYVGYGDLALMIVAGVGLLGIGTRRLWIKKLQADFYARKYKIAEGFRTN